MAHNHYVYDNDAHFIVHPFTRTIRKAKSKTHTVIQNDHQSERITFEIPRYIDGHDMLNVTRAEIHYLNIEADTQAHQSGCYIADDLQVLPHDSKMIQCSWLLSRNATKYVGSLHFLLRFVCASEEDTDYVWSTAIYSEIKVAPGFSFSEEAVEAYPDILSQWENQLHNLSENFYAFQKEVTEMAEFLLETDETLSVSGAAADSKVTGDRLKTVEDQIADILYKPITINSFTNDVGTAEIGSYVKAVSLKWSFNKTPTTVTLDGMGMLPEFTGYSQTGLNITENTTFTLKATDERGTEATKTTSITFLNGVYYGVSAAPETLDSAFILTLTKNLRSTKLPSFTVNAYAGEYIYYCVPKRFGACTFSVGGFVGGFMLADTVSFTNASGYTEDYYVYRSDYQDLGKTTVTVG